jgi:cobalamin biosynthesis protein CbiG
MATTSFWIGLGCQQGVTAEAIEQAIIQALAGQPLGLVRGIATIQSKAQEPGILAICAKYGWLLKLYDSSALGKVAVSYSSAVVQQVTGTGSVAEAAATLAAGHASGRQVYEINGQFVTVAIGLQAFEGHTQKSS